MQSKWNAGTMMAQKRQARLPRAVRPDFRNALVRLGSRYDGGYIFAAGLLANTQQVLTFGLGYNWEFEKAIAEQESVERIDCYDHTVTRANWRKIYILSILKYFFNTKKRRANLFLHKDYRSFFGAPGIARHYPMMVGSQDRADATTVGAALARLPGESLQIFLKCDIEGHEYEIMDAIVDHANRFCAIALEFHDVHERLPEFLDAIKRLRKTHFLDHVHVNNMSTFDSDLVPSVVEISFSRMDVSSTGTGSATGDFPISRDGTELDAPNDPGQPDVDIVFN